MKSKSMKYEEAIERNLKAFEASVANAHGEPWSTSAVRRKLSKSGKKHLIGIKQSDTRFDHLPCLNLQ